MQLALHFDSMHSELGSPYHLEPQRRVLAALLAQRECHIDSRILTGDLLFGSIPDRKSPDVVGLWFFPQNPVWTRPNGVDWNLPLHHMAIYAICFESVDQEAAERLHESLTSGLSLKKVAHE